MKKIEQYFGRFPLLKGFSENWNWLEDVSHANPFYSPMYYIICKQIEARNILEVGCEYGYSSYMLATAAKESGGVFYCVEKSRVFADLLEKGLTEREFPHAVIWADIRDVKEFIWADYLDFVLFDAEHTPEVVLHSMDLVYPKLRGNSYVALHDVDLTSASSFYQIIHDRKYDFEHITFPGNYGLALFRRKDLDEDEKRKILAHQVEVEVIPKIDWAPGGGPAPPGSVTLLPVQSQVISAPVQSVNVLEIQPQVTTENVQGKEAKEMISEIPGHLLQFLRETRRGVV